ncbi:hypothetical protein [Streptomyces sp. 900105245]
MPILVSLALDKGLDLLSTALGQGLLVLMLAACAAGAWLYQHRRTALARHVVRRYGLLGTADVDGALLHHETTRAPGTVVTRRIRGQVRRFELTDAPLGDGTFAAEPVDDL